MDTYLEPDVRSKQYIKGKQFLSARLDACAYSSLLREERVHGRMRKV